MLGFISKIEAGKKEIHRIAYQNERSTLTYSLTLNIYAVYLNLRVIKPRYNICFEFSGLFINLQFLFLFREGRVRLFQSCLIQFLSFETINAWLFLRFAPRARQNGRIRNSFS